ncbi:MAG: hypothetical protein ACRC57_06270 [Sarcina sp.]
MPQNKNKKSQYSKITGFEKGDSNQFKQNPNSDNTMEERLGKNKSKF